MPATGNTTIPTDPEAPSSASSSSLASRVVPCFFLAWSAHQPDRIGEVALFDPLSPAPFLLGREDVGDPARVHFSQLRPGEAIDGGPLTGVNISRQQFRITVEGDALRVENIGNAPAKVDGTDFPKDATVLLSPGAVLEVLGNCVLLVGRSPLALPPPAARLLPLHPFGEPDRMGMVGESARMHQLREDVCFAATAGRHVFVHGQTGTGKELLARAIHDLSPRSAGPYLTANSASFTIELAALELFGNPARYPNPGTPARIGYFGEAKGGTLLLDEMGEVLDAVQAPLLRALDGAYNRVGDPTSRPTECVVILATNRDSSAIKHDILFRLGVTVETPSLAERREDIPLLVRWLLLRKADRDPALAKALVRRGPHGGRSVELDASLVVGLLRSPLRGNVRELDNILTAAVAPPGGRAPLRWPARQTLPPPAPLVTPSAPRVPPAEPSGPSVEALVEGIRGKGVPSKKEVARAIEDHHHVYEKAAKALGLGIDQLFRLRKKYDLA